MPAGTLERRVVTLQDAKVTRAKDGGALRFHGRPWVYGQMSGDMGGWQEVVDQGAATRTLAAQPDVRFLLNHDANYLLARTNSGTLTLSEDEAGGIADAELADVSYARDLAVLIERGDLTQMSFGFWIRSDSWAGNLHRVHEFDLDGGDVSAVTFPAFPQTSSELRAAARRHIADPGTDPDVASELAEALEAITGYAGDWSERALELGKQAAEVITRALPAEVPAERPLGLDQHHLRELTQALAL